MPILKNSKWEHFAQLVAEGGKPHGVAYAEVYGQKSDGTSRAHASRLLATNGNVRDRIEELQKEAERAVKWSIQERLEVLRDISLGQLDGEDVPPRDRIRAIELYTKIAGDGAAEKHEHAVSAEVTELSAIIAFLRTGEKAPEPSLQGMAQCECGLRMIG